MSWFMWVLIFLCLSGAWANLAQVGKHGQTKRINGPACAVAAVVNIILVFGVLINEGIF